MRVRSGGRGLGFTTATTTTTTTSMVMMATWREVERGGEGR